jgi:hypothetical protein
MEVIAAIIALITKLVGNKSDETKSGGSTVVHHHHYPDPNPQPKPDSDEEKSKGCCGCLVILFILFMVGTCVNQSTKTVSNEQKTTEAEPKRQGVDRPNKNKNKTEEPSPQKIDKPRDLGDSE